MPFGTLYEQTQDVAAAAMFLIALGAPVLAVVYDYARVYFVGVAAAVVGVLALWQRRRPPG